MEDVAAEVLAFKEWQPVNLETALRQPRSRIMRCPECHGRVRAHKEGSTGQKAHIEHHERNRGCSRGDCFDGTARRHHHPLGG